jgi:DNA-binding transcriptional MerR regulator/methylmalonyl-CoA mutase cobalamin-binding subunit
MDDETLYPMRVAVSRTGITAHVLRAWERRYQAVEPVRTETNRRLYRPKDLRRLKLLKRVVDSGYNIGHVAALETEALAALLSEQAAPAVPQRDLADTLPSWDEPAINVDLLTACQNAVRAMDGDELMHLLESALIHYSQHNLFEEIVLPLLWQIGTAWQDGDLRIAHERLASGVIRTFVGNLLQGPKVDPAGPQIVVGTLAGQDHEIGALIVSCLAAAQGWRTIYLGANLPAEEIVAVAKHTGAKVIALSFVYPGDDPRTHQEIALIGRLCKHITGLELIAGGRAANGYTKALADIGGELIEDLGDFRRYLDELRD